MPLSPQGKKEAEKLAERLADSGIETLVSSDLQRAENTAKAIAKTTGARVLTTTDLRPWNLGEFTGRDSNIVHPRIVAYAKNKPDQAIPNGESFNHFAKRVFKVLHKILSDYGDEKLGIVAHHRTERFLKSFIDAGQPASGELNFATMWKHGEKTAHSEKMTLDLKRLEEAAANVGRT